MTQRMNMYMLFSKKFLNKKAIGIGLITGYLGYNYYIDYNKYIEYNDLSKRKLFALKIVPWNIVSKVAGYMSSLNIPIFLRSPIYGGYSWIFGCNLEETKAPSLKAFPTFNHFFSRELKDGARVIDSKSIISSPCDGRVCVVGKIALSDSTLETSNVLIEQVKGVNYSLKNLVGEKEYLELTKDKSKSLYYCSIYLSPGAYHRFHSPINNWYIERTRRIQGELFPVSPYFMKYVKEVSFLNERMLIDGRWKYGKFMMLPVGATNVGSIISNVKGNETVQMGKDIGKFELGSMVILVFTGPSGLEWLITPNQRIKLGSALMKNNEKGFFNFLF